jgi:hypothetical protein
LVLGAGLEPACLSAYAPQTYVSAIPPPEPYSRERQNFPQSAAAGKYRFVLVLMFVIVIESLKRIPLEHDRDQENEILATQG